MAGALIWLKENNSYYEDMIIDNEILQLLPKNGSIINKLQQVQNDQIIDESPDDNENEDDRNHEDTENEVDEISRTFVPSITPTRREGVAINDTLDCVQRNDQPILWPEIEGVPINEFQTSKYMVRAFPTLYPYRRADLRSERTREIKPVEYFKHLLWYNDGRFRRHSR